MNKNNDENNNDVFGPDELVVYKEGDKIMSGGYMVKSLLMKGGKSPITSYFKGGTLESGIHDNSDSDSDSDLEKEEKMETKGKDPFLNLAVPAGIMLIVQQPNQSEYEKKSYANEKYRNCDMLSDDIYDKLFEFASFKQKRKDKGIQDKKTSRTNNRNNELPKKLTKRKRP